MLVIFVDIFRERVFLQFPLTLQQTWGLFVGLITTVYMPLVPVQEILLMYTLQLSPAYYLLLFRNFQCDLGAMYVDSNTWVNRFVYKLVDWFTGKRSWILPNFNNTAESVETCVKNECFMYKDDVNWMTINLLFIAHFINILMHPSETIRTSGSSSCSFRNFIVYRKHFCT